MNSMRKKRLVTIHIPGETVYDSEGFPKTEPEKLLKVYCAITRAQPDELHTYNVDKLTEILRLKCPWNRVRNIVPDGVKLTVDGRKYELWGPFVNVDMLNIEAYFEAKRIT